MTPIVRHIVSTVNGFSHVILDRADFYTIRGDYGKSNGMKFTVGVDKARNEVRVYDFGSKKVYEVREYNNVNNGNRTLTTKFVMKEQDALDALNSDRNDAEQFDFSISELTNAEAEAQAAYETAIH